MRLDSGIIENYQRTGGKFWLSANHNRHVTANMTYTGGHSLEEKYVPPLLQNLKVMLIFRIIFTDWLLMQEYLIK
jgi:hypothetical protein